MQVPPGYQSKEPPLSLGDMLNNMTVEIIWIA